MTPTCWCARQRHPHHVHRPAGLLALVDPLGLVLGPYCPSAAVPQPPQRERRRAAA